MGTFSYAGAGGEGGRQQVAVPLSKDETKNMLTIMMSDIVYGHYMEALAPGNFQKNINEIYRLNGLKPVKFPTPSMAATVVEACKEIFREHSREEAGRQTDEDRSGAHTSGEPDLEMDLDDEAIEREEREIETMIKRHRESMTPPHRDDKRKKQEEEIDRTQKSTQKTPQQEKQTVKQTAQVEMGATAKTQREPRWARDEEERQERRENITPTPI